MKGTHRIISVLGCLTLCAALALPLDAQTVEELQAQIEANNAEIERINQEIARFEAQLAVTAEEKNSLQKKISQLSIQRQQLQAEINRTRSQINTTQLQIQQLGGTIEEKEQVVQAYRASLAASIRRLNETETQSLAIAILGSDSLSAAWSDMDALASLQTAVRDDIALLRTEQRALSDSKASAEEKRQQLLAEQQRLSTQRGSLQATINVQNELLEETESKESEYERIIAQKQAEKEAFESAIFDLASQIEYTLDPSKVPVAGAGVLRWPLDNVHVTQQFGRTSASGRLYSSGTHNGIDLRASIGTPVRTALTGTVVEVNHGSVKNCQYGKWVVVKHANGLATLYAHLSSVSVAAGETLVTGQVLGYSGDTGYATGPHLHFTVYLADALTFKSYKCNSGYTVRIPIAPVEGYLNPMDYL